MDIKYLNELSNLIDDTVEEFELEESTSIEIKSYFRDAVLGGAWSFPHERTKLPTEKLQIRNALMIAIRDAREAIPSMDPVDRDLAKEAIETVQSNLTEMLNG